MKKNEAGCLLYVVTPPEKPLKQILSERPNAPERPQGMIRDGRGNEMCIARKFKIRLINCFVPGSELKSGKCITITELSDRLWERMQAGMGPSCFYYFGLPRFPGVAQ